jgi:hypothetical protein
VQKTLETLITETQQKMYQAAGPGVQVYSEDLIAQKILEAFDRCFKAKFWPQFLKREVRTLDGVTGKVSAPFTYIKEWDDVHSVFRSNSSNPIPTMPESYNLLDLSAHTTPKFLEPSNDTTLFTVYPLTSTGQIVVVGRGQPTGWGAYTATDTIPFDYLALEYLAAWEYATDEASNAAMAAKFQQLFNSRMNQLEDAAFDNVVLLSPRSDQIPTEWS